MENQNSKGALTAIRLTLLQKQILLMQRLENYQENALKENQSDQYLMSISQNENALEIQKQFKDLKESQNQDSFHSIDYSSDNYSCEQIEKINSDSIFYSCRSIDQNEKNDSALTNTEQRLPQYKSNNKQISENSIAAQPNFIEHNMIQSQSQSQQVSQISQQSQLSCFQADESYSMNEQISQESQFQFEQNYKSKKNRRVKNKPIQKMQKKQKNKKQPKLKAINQRNIKVQKKLQQIQQITSKEKLQKKQIKIKKNHKNPNKKHASKNNIKQKTADYSAYNAIIDYFN